MRSNFAIAALVAALAIAGSVQLSAQDSAPGNWQLYLIPDGKTVYDSVNGVTWLTDANLAASKDADSANDAAADDAPPRFGLPLCNPASTGACIWADGAMSYTSAQEWVRRMNAAGYLGHSHWRLPSTPFKDSGCTSKGPSHENFGFGCSAGALGFLYYAALGIEAPNTAVPIPSNTVGPFQDFQPGVYWSGSYGGGLKDSKANFSFADGGQGGTNTFNYSYVLPMIKGKIPGTPPASGNGLELSPDGLTVYDPVADVTWPADANLAVQKPFSLKPCKSPAKPTLCMANDGSMNYASAEKFVADMNSANYGAETSLLLTVAWELPPSDPACPQYNCTERNPMGELYYNQLGLQAGTPVVPIPDNSLSPFLHLQPGYYWSCEGSAINQPCIADSTPVPNTGAQFDFSFGNGFLSTAREPGAHFVTVYFVGCDLPNAEECVIVTPPKPPIPPKCPPTDPSCYQ